MKVIYTYWVNKDQQSAGFNNTKSLAYCLALSVQYSKKYYKSVELVTNTEGKKLLIDKYKIPFTSVSVALNGLEVYQDLWAFAKLTAYSIQKNPFIAIDIDCILWQKIPPNILKSKIFFQHKETFSQQPGYKHLINSVNGTTVSYWVREKKIDYAYNCGVTGVNDLNLVKEWYAIARDFILNPANKHFWDSLENKGQMNYLFEQYFIAAITKNIPAKVLIENFSFKNVVKPKFKMTHLWGETKKKPEEIDKIKNRLKKEFPEIFKRIDIVKRDDVFSGLFKKGTARYQKDLKKAISNGVKSVVYLGYDGFKSSKFIDEKSDIDFVYSNSTKHHIPKCDLLIIKDMIPLWTGKELVEFFKKKAPAKWIIDGSGLFKN